MRACGHAHELLDKMSRRPATSFNALIKSKISLGRVNEAISLLLSKKASNLPLTSFSLVPILSSPSLTSHRANQLHPLILKSGLLHSDPYTSTALLNCFARNGKINDAVKLFDEMPIKTVVTWNSLISSFSHMGLVEYSMNYFREIMRSGTCLSEGSFVSILSAFDSSNWKFYVDQVHGLITKFSMNIFIEVSNSLLNAYCVCAGVEEGERLFSLILVRDLVSWNTMITSFSKSCVPEQAFRIFFMMQLDSYFPNETSFTSIITACTGLNEPIYGKLIHAKAIKCNLNKSVYVGNSLVTFYARCVDLTNAYKLFDEMPNKSVVLWNALISGYTHKQDSLTPLPLLKNMLSLNIRPNERSFSSCLKHTSKFDLEQIHSLIIKMGYERNIYVLSSINSSYAFHGIISDSLVSESCSNQQGSNVATNILARVYNKSGRYEETKEIFLERETLDKYSWNMLLTACARNGDYTQAFDLFKQMQELGFVLDNYIVVSLLTICSKNNNSLTLGKSLHGLLIKSKLGRLDTFVQNILLDMYAKCGSLKDSLKVFDYITERDLISWTALISVLGQHGFAREAIDRFNAIIELGFKPDRVTLLAVLSACRHGGLVEEGMQLFGNMEGIFGIKPDTDHYVCIVDLLCKNGRTKEAEFVISSMDFQPSASIWRAFLKGCERFGITALVP